MYSMALNEKHVDMVSLDTVYPHILAFIKLRPREFYC